LQLRVSKGLGSKPYGTLRVSVIGSRHDAPLAGFDYSAPFEHRWKEFRLSSSLIEVPAPGKPYQHSFGPGMNVSLWLPAQGAGVAGVLIADPCMRFASIATLVDCTNAGKFKTAERTVPLLNAFLGHDDTDYWGILGDNFYDQSGSATQRIFSQLKPPALSKVMVAVAVSAAASNPAPLPTSGPESDGRRPPAARIVRVRTPPMSLSVCASQGNHDYWILAAPEVATTLDQFANGFMQYYAQDTLAAKALAPGSTSPPFNFSVDPSAGHLLLGGRPPAIDNSFSYFQVGNVGVIGFTAAYTINEILPRLEEACAWLPTQQGLELAILVGHWDTHNTGATKDTSTPGAYEHARLLAGCDAFDSRGMLKFVMVRHPNPNPRHAQVCHGPSP
jgi:hypothetical protein